MVAALGALVEDPKLLSDARSVMEQRPVLGLHSDIDEVCPADAAQAYVSSLSHGSFHVFPGAPHVGLLPHARTEYTRLLADFVDASLET
jgi:pimeloyl-ACP methyl ester carboxylesterase